MKELLALYIMNFCNSENGVGFLKINPDDIIEEKDGSLKLINASINLSKMPDFLLNPVLEDTGANKEDILMFTPSYSNGNIVIPLNSECKNSNIRQALNTVIDIYLTELNGILNDNSKHITIVGD